jgi:cytochrome c peroxidase
MLRSDGLYRQLFPEAFAGERNPFSVPNAVKAIASFERTMISARSPYDRFHYGETDAISKAAQRGEALFFNDQYGGCFRCHAGFNFSDAAGQEVKFHNTALYNLPGLLSYPAPNVGIYEFTRRAADVGKFKAPSLRNVALTAPYMHDGSIATLEEVVKHYEAGGRKHDNPNRDARIKPFGLTDRSRADMVEFLRSLTDTWPAR